MSTIRYQTETSRESKDCDFVFTLEGDLLKLGTSRAIGNWPVNSVTSRKKQASLRSKSTFKCAFRTEARE